MILQAVERCFTSFCSAVFLYRFPHGFPRVSPWFLHIFDGHQAAPGSWSLRCIPNRNSMRRTMVDHGRYIYIYIYVCVCVHVVFNCEILRVFMSWQGLFVRDENNIIHHDTRSQRTCRHWWCGHTRSAGVRRLFCCLCVSECAAAPDRISQSFTNLSHSQGSVNKMPGLLPRMFLCHLLSEIV